MIARAHFLQLCALGNQLNKTQDFSLHRTEATVPDVHARYKSAGKLFFLSENRVNCFFFSLFSMSLAHSSSNAAVSNNQNCLHVVSTDILPRAIPINLMTVTSIYFVPICHIIAHHIVA